VSAGTDRLTAVPELVADQRRTGALGRRGSGDHGSLQRSPRRVAPASVRRRTYIEHRRAHHVTDAKGNPPGHTQGDISLTDARKILGIAGSLRKASYNRHALLAARDLLPAGVKLDIAELEGLAPFNQDKESSPSPELLAFKKAIRAADAILFATPEYNYGVPGVLKNAIDCASRPYGDSAWVGKPVAVMGASIGLFGTVRAQLQLRQSFVFLNMHPVNQPEVMIGNAAKAFDAKGKLVDETSIKLLRQLLQNLVSAIGPYTSQATVR